MLRALTCRSAIPLESVEVLLSGRFSARLACCFFPRSSSRLTAKLREAHQIPTHHVVQETKSGHTANVPNALCEITSGGKSEME
ncbi:hypothetical protein J6590_076575 [Homalodisca vitripennis]|nr:hypothetical protein J6590_076575 [Homalodisca vitripennis]